MINVELHDDHIEDAINDAYRFHLKWGIGQSSQQVCFTKALSAGVREYSLPGGVKTVVEVKDFSSNLGGSQELFSVSNFIYQHYMTNITGYTLIDYEISMQFIDLLEKYNSSKYAWKYHPFNNTILFSPTPVATDLTQTQYFLVDCFIEEGYTIDGDSQDSDWKEHLYEDPWFKDYCIALCKVTLGLIRRKLANLTSLGNASISLDGEMMASEGKEEKELLEEELKQSNWEGMNISYN